jgi:hypothetical protein
MIFDSSFGLQKFLFGLWVGHPCIIVCTIIFMLEYTIFSDRIHKNNYARPRCFCYLILIKILNDLFYLADILYFSVQKSVKKYSKKEENLKFQTTNPINILFQKQASENKESFLSLNNILFQLPYLYSIQHDVNLPNQMKSRNNFCMIFI